MDPISCDIFGMVRFKYLEAEYRILSMQDFSNGSFFKLVLMFLKWLEHFPKRLWFSSSMKILNFYFL